tara:strand:- start:4091 stop:4456 length:366 start_codon:yes stop_codon:yes gene_type:complete
LTKTNRKIECTRLETWATPGVPDVVFCAENGLFSFVELKIVKKNKMELSPHQCAWLSRHSHSNSWIVARNSDLAINCYRGADAVDLRMDGANSVSPVQTFKEPYDWEKFYALICPVDSVIK